MRTPKQRFRRAGATRRLAQLGRACALVLVGLGVPVGGAGASSVTATGLSLPPAVGASPALREKIESAPKLTLAGRFTEAEAMLRAAMPEVEAFFGAQSREAAFLRHELGVVLVWQNRTRAAEPEYRKAIAILEQIGAPDLELANALTNLGYVLARDRADEASPILERALGLLEKQPEPNALAVARAGHLLANVRSSQQRPGDAEALERRALALREEALGANDLATAASLDGLGVILGAQGRDVEAEPLLRRALRIGEAHPDARADDRARPAFHLAEVRLRRGDAKEAERLLRRAIADYDADAAGENPDSAVPRVALARLLLAADRTDEAETLLRAALATQERDGGVASREAGQSLYELAMIALRRGRTQEARNLSDRALAIAEKDPAIPAPALAEIRIFRATAEVDDQADDAIAGPMLEKALLALQPGTHASPALEGRGAFALARIRGRQLRIPESTALLRRALAAEERVEPRVPDRILIVQAHLGRGLALQGDVAGAERSFRAARAEMVQARIASPIVRLLVLSPLCDLLTTTGRYQEAEPECREGIRHGEAAGGAAPEELSMAYDRLAVLLGSTGRSGEAEAPARRAIALREQLPAPLGPVLVATSLNNLAMTYLQTRRFGDAIPPLERAVGIWQTVTDPTGAGPAQALHNLAVAQTGLGRIDDAAASYTRAIGQRDGKPGAATDVAYARLLTDAAGIDASIGRFDLAKIRISRAVGVYSTALGSAHPMTAAARTAQQEIDQRAALAAPPNAR